MKVAELTDGRIIMAIATFTRNSSATPIIRLELYKDMQSPEMLDRMDLSITEAKDLRDMVEECLGGRRT